MRLLGSICRNLTIIGAPSTVKRFGDVPVGREGAIAQHVIDVPPSIAGHAEIAEDFPFETSSIDVLFGDCEKPKQSGQSRTKSGC